MVAVSDIYRHDRGSLSEISTPVELSIDTLS